METDGNSSGVLDLVVETSSLLAGYVVVVAVWLLLLGMGFTSDLGKEMFDKFEVGLGSITVGVVMDVLDEGSSIPTGRLNKSSFLGTDRLFSCCYIWVVRRYDGAFKTLHYIFGVECFNISLFDDRCK